jgi:hypothetical protein
MKIMKGVMKNNGDLDDMGMQISLNQMDMNVDIYPEITGTNKKKETSMSGVEMGSMPGMNGQN